LTKNIAIKIWGTGLVISTMPYLFSQDTNTSSHSLSIVFPEVALLDIESESGENISFILDGAALDAGENVEFHQERSSLWLNYTSLISTMGSERSISVKASNLPDIPGLIISLEAENYIGTGEGTYGIPTATIIPTEMEKQLITGIGSAYTGDGPSNGHRLKYYLDYSGSYADFSKEKGSQNITITYTITD